MQRKYFKHRKIGTEEISVSEVVNNVSFVGGQGSENSTFQRIVPKNCVCANPPIYFITQNVTTVNRAVTSDFNYD
jgi:hypothetical protein